MGRVPSRGSDQFVVRFPEGMREMIREAAEANGRSMNAEILDRMGQSFTNWPRIDVPFEFYERAVASPAAVREQIEARINDAALRILEDAFPKLFQPFPDLDMRVLQWHSDAWHPVDWDTWTRFRANESAPRIEGRMTDKQNYFVVLVFDEDRFLCNIISHNYILKDGRYVSAAFDRLTEDERQEYNRYMTAVTDTEQDRERIQYLRSKMEPALSLPLILVEKLRDTLKELAPEDVLEDLLKRVS